MECASVALSRNKVFLAACLEVNPKSFKYLPSQILQDKQFFIEIIQAQMNNSELISEILHLHGELLRYTCEKIKDDKSMVSRAIGSHCSALKHASKRLKEDCDLRFQALHSCASNGCYCIMIELIHDCSDSSVP